MQLLTMHQNTLSHHPLAVDRYAGLDPNYQYSKAQLAHYAPDPEKHKRFLPRLSRKDRSSYADPQVEQEFFEEVR